MGLTVVISIPFLSKKTGGRDYLKHDNALETQEV